MVWAVWVGACLLLWFDVLLYIVWVGACLSFCFSHAEFAYVCCTLCLSTWDGCHFGHTNGSSC
jgi:hypothetical protein